MRSFVDTKHRRWSVEITVGHVRDVRKRLGLDLPSLIDDGCKGLGDLLADPCRFVDVLWCLIEPDGAFSGVTDEEFGRSLGGDMLDAASDAFVGALIDFFPSPQTRASLRKIIETVKALQIEKADAVEAVLRQLRSGSSGSVPAASDSIPTDTRSVS
jgi:hypothetical protein